MPIITDWNNKLILITSPTTEVDMQTLHDHIEDSMASPRGSTDDDILAPEGKIEDPTNPGVFSQIIVILSSLWQIQFWGGSGYTRIYGGKLVGGVSDQPMKATGTAGDITVLESPVDGVTVGIAGSGGLTTEEHDHLLALETTTVEGQVSALDVKIDILNNIINDINNSTINLEIGVELIKKVAANNFTKTGDIITIFEDDEITIFREYNVANNERILI